MSKVANPLGSLKAKNLQSPVKAANLSIAISPSTAVSSPMKSPQTMHVRRPSDDLLKAIQLKKKKTPLNSPSHSRQTSYDKVKPKIKIRHGRNSSIVNFGDPTYDILISSTLAAKASLDCKGFCFTPYTSNSIQDLIDTKPRDHNILNEAEAFECKLVIEQLNTENKKLEGESKKLSWIERRRVRNLSQELDKQYLTDEFERAIDHSLAIKRINNLRENEKNALDQQRRQEELRTSRELKQLRSSTEKLLTQEELERSQNKLIFSNELKESNRQTAREEALDKRQDRKHFIECIKQRESEDQLEQKQKLEYDYSEQLKFKLKKAWLENQNLKKKLDLEKKLLLP